MNIYPSTKTLGGLKPFQVLKPLTTSSHAISTFSKCHNAVWRHAMQAKEKACDAGISMNFLVQDVETASFADGSFDCILCSNGMAYLQDPQATLQRFHSWLSPGSMLCFNNPKVGRLLASLSYILACNSILYLLQSSTEFLHSLQCQCSDLAGPHDPSHRHSTALGRRGIWPEGCGCSSCIGDA